MPSTTLLAALPVLVHRKPRSPVGRVKPAVTHCLTTQNPALLGGVLFFLGFVRGHRAGLILYAASAFWSLGITSPLRLPLIGGCTRPTAGPDRPAAPAQINGKGLILVLYLLATALRWWAGEHLASWDFYPRTETHCSGLFLGCLLGYARVAIHRYWAVVGVITLFYAMTFFSTRWMPTVIYGFTIAEIGAALMILAQPAWLGGSMLAWLGRMSYGLYLWHYPIMRLVRDRDGWEWPEVLLLGGGLGLLLAVLSHYLLERRFHQPRFSVSRNGLA